MHARFVGLALRCRCNAWPQQFPTKPIKMVVGFAPGGMTDILARIVAKEHVHAAGGQQVIVREQARR